MVLAAKDGRQREQEQTEAAERVFPFLLWPLRFRVCFLLSTFYFPLSGLRFHPSPLTSLSGFSFPPAPSVFICVHLWSSVAFRFQLSAFIPHPWLVCFLLCLRRGPSVPASVLPALGFALALTLLAYPPAQPRIRGDWRNEHRATNACRPIRPDVNSPHEQS